MTKAVDYLIVSFSTMPLPRPRSYQIAKLLKHIKGSYFIITSDCLNIKNLDFGLDKYAGYTSENSFRVKDIAVTNKIVNVFFNAFSLLSSLPDNHWLWGYYVVSLAKRLKRKITPKVVIAFSRPETDLVVGVKLRKIFNVPLVVHFSDPWVNNPYKKYNRIERWINKKLESKVMKNADLILFTNDDQKNLVMRNYPENIQKKFNTIYHCYDKNLYDAGPGKNNSRFVIRHLGNLYGQRKPDSLLQATHDLLKQYPELEEKLVIEFYGQVSQDVLRAVKSLDLERVITFHKPVSYLESLRLMTSSDLLLSIDAESDYNIFFPSKIVDYMGSEKDIIGISSLQGASADIIRNYGGRIFAHSQTEEIKKAIYESVMGKRKFSINDNELKKYDAKEVACRFERLVGNAACGR